MKTTLDLPDDLMKEIKLRAVKENRKLKDAIAELLKRGLATERKPAGVRNKVKLPLVRCAHRARPGREVTPDRVSELLLAEEAEWSRGPVR